MTPVAVRLKDPAQLAPADIVRLFPNPIDIVRAYLDSDYAHALASEHERIARRIVEEGSPAVLDHASYAAVGERLVEVSRHRKAVEEFFEPVTQLFYRFHQAACGRRTEVVSILTEWEAAAKRNRLALEQQDARERREREQREAEAARQIEMERIAREAEHLAATEPELANAILEEAVAAPMPMFAIASTLPKTKGIAATRENWKWEPLLGNTPEGRVRAEKMVPREFLELSDRKLTAYAKAHKGAARVVGIRFYDAGSVPVR